MLVDRGAQVVQIELAPPVGEHRRMGVGVGEAVAVLRRRAIGAIDLDIVNTDRRT